MLSSEISVLRESARTARDSGRRPPWRRLLVPTASAMTVAIVLGVGLMLFNRPLIEMVFPDVREAEATPIVISPSWEPEWVLIKGGDFHVGPPFDVSDEEIETWLVGGAEAAIGKFNITNARWLEFLLAKQEWLVSEALWKAGRGSMVPSYATGWRREGGSSNPSGMPIIPEARGAADAHVDVRNTDHVRTFLKWHASTPEYYLSIHGVTNQAWLEFLEEQEGALREAGVFEECIPSAGSGWHRTGNHSLPAPPIELIERDADELPVSHVGDGALALFWDWLPTSGFWTWPPRIEGLEAPPNWLWLEFLTANEVELTETGLWQEAVPRPESGWKLDAFFGPVMPTYPNSRVDRHRITGVGTDALRRFHDWSSLERGDHYDFEISRYEITNAMWRDFIEARSSELAAEGVLDEANPGHYGGWERDASGRYAPRPDVLDLPVRNVSALAASRFGEYLTDRLDQPGYLIRVPTAREWEFAARGTGWRAYPWGRDFLLPSEPGTGDPKPPYGTYDRRPLPVESVDPIDRSPAGVLGLGTNVREFAERWERDARGEEYLVRTELRGASFSDDIPKARRRARVWDFLEVDDRRTPRPDVGVRLVKWFNSETPAEPVAE